MKTSPTEKMTILLEQLQIEEADRASYFTEAQLLKLDVYKKKKQWVFHFELPHVLPIQMFKQFRMKLQQTFQSVATIDFTIQSREQSVDGELMQYYWRDFLESSAALSPAYRDWIEQQLPVVKNQKLYLKARNETESVVLKNRFNDSFRSYCLKYGLPTWKVECETEVKTEDIQKFQEQKALEDKLMVKKAMEDQQKQQKAKADDPNKDEALVIGYPIKEEAVSMESITEENRRIIFEGYVFDAEIRELKSGRHLLIAKITDYTDSFSVKMFSRDDRDKERLARVKKGMWVKVRGTIQTDTFSNELTMMMNDLNEITVATREDTYPEDEKRIELHAHTMMSQMDAVLSPAQLVEQAAKWGIKR